MKHILYELLVFLRLKKRTIPNDNEILGYFRMFYLFLSAGISVKESLEQCKVTVSPLMQPITKKILSKMDNGYDLELAMQETKVFPKYITDLVEAGRKNGSLKDIALEIIFFLEQKIDIKRKVNSGLFIVKIMSFILVVLIVAAFIVINKFKEILNDTKGELPTFTKLVLDFGDIVSNNWYIILFFVIVLLISFKILKKQYREKFDSLMFKVPIYGPIYKNLSFYRMSRIMSLTVQTGIAVEDSFEYASLAVDNIYFKNFINKIIDNLNKKDMLFKDAIEKANKEYKLLDNSFILILAAGRKSGNVKVALDSCAADYKRELMSLLSTVSDKVITPALFIIFIIVAIIYAAIMLPINNIWSSAQMMSK